MNLEELSDEELARLTQNGQMYAFSELVRRYHPKLLGYGRRFLRTSEDAEDAVQDALIAVYRNIARFRVTERFSPWVYRIAHNQFISLIRKRKREPLPFFDADTLFPHPVASDDVEHEADIGSIRRQLDAGLTKLDSKYREVLVLRYDQDLSYSEIADILHIPVGTVGIRIKRGLGILHTLFQSNESTITSS